jgi:hypothetical protein
VAFGLVRYDSSSDGAPFTKSYGTLEASIKIWGEKDENGKNKPTYF